MFRLPLFTETLYDDFCRIPKFGFITSPFEMPKPIWKNYRSIRTLAFCKRNIYHDQKNTSEFPIAMSERIFEPCEPPSTFAESKHRRTTTRTILTKLGEIQSETVEAPSTHSHIYWIYQNPITLEGTVEQNNDDESAGLSSSPHYPCTPQSILER